MNLKDLEDKRDKCIKDQRQLTQRHFARTKWIEYFTCKKAIQLRALKPLVVLMGIFYIASMAAVACGNQPVSIMYLSCAFGVLPAAIIKVYACNKFDKVLKKLVENDEKISKELSKAYKDEVELTYQIKQLREEEYKLLQQEAHQAQTINLNIDPEEPMLQAQEYIA